MKQPNNCPRCALSFARHPNSKSIKTCCLIYWSKRNDEITNVTIYFSTSILININICLMGRSETSIYYKGKYMIIPFSMPELIFKSEEELLSWIKTMIIFQ